MARLKPLEVKTPQAISLSWFWRFTFVVFCRSGSCCKASGEYCRCEARGELDPDEACFNCEASGKACSEGCCKVCSEVWCRCEARGELDPVAEGDARRAEDEECAMKWMNITNKA
jgi:hypothetical protein